jgi:hypothetical protein
MPNYYDDDELFDPHTTAYHKARERNVNEMSLTLEDQCPLFKQIIFALGGYEDNGTLYLESAQRLPITEGTITVGNGGPIKFRLISKGDNRMDNDGIFTTLTTNWEIRVKENND